jgi:hypothetical protein
MTEQKTVNGYEGIYSMDELKANLKAHRQMNRSMEYVLYEPFSEWLSLQNIIEGWDYEPRNYPDATFCHANDTHAFYLVHGTSPRTLGEHGEIIITHNRERFVKFPLAFIENKAPYEEAARKAIEERAAREEAAERRALEIRLELIESERNVLLKSLNH